MTIQSIRLQNFRSYKDESFEFEPGVNIVVGPNASGKTNLLESILVLARGGSYRAKDIDLIQFNKTWARLDGVFSGNHVRVLKLDKSSNLLSKELLLDSNHFKRLSLDRTVPIVFFEPQHLQLITHGPEKRRDYLDDLLARSQPGFKKLANAYLRTLAQRNSLLKKPPSKVHSQLFAWNIRLAELAGQIVKARSELVNDINQMVTGSYSQIAHQPSNVELSYLSQFNIENYSSKLLKKLEASAELDLARGFTGCGPHREDLGFYLNHQPMAQTASRGETRSLLLALKIFELEMLTGTREQKPIFLLDDVFSELDGARRRHLVESLKDYQTIITTTDADAAIEYFAGNHNLIPLSGNN